MQGNDTYDCHSQAQGFGGVKGFGALVDVRGDDKYVADDTKIDNPAPQTAQHNTSLSQGVGFGRRANPGDGHSMAGGVGMLVDGAGNDFYKCGVFGQGVSIVQPRRSCVDFGGNDSYDGVWYVQGSAAHYSLGCLLDLGGDDPLSCPEWPRVRAKARLLDWSAPRFWGVGIPLRPKVVGLWFRTVERALDSSAPRARLLSPAEEEATPLLLCIRPLTHRNMQCTLLGARPSHFQKRTSRGQIWDDMASKNPIGARVWRRWRAG